MMTEKFRIKIDSVNGKVQYQVQQKKNCCWMVLASFDTRRDAKKFIEHHQQG